jgi:tRNA threonylcarbamoyladenosine biosynthesis protein TsaB
MRVLVLDSALARCAAALVIDDAVTIVRSELRRQGHEVLLPVMAREVMAAADGVDLVAVTVGPGSFTGIRAGLALAHGIALAAGVPIVGVTVGEAIAEAFPRLGSRTLWVVSESRRDHIFLERDGDVMSLAAVDVPQPEGAVALAGPAALDVAARLAARDANVMLTDARYPEPRHIAVVAARRHNGELPPRPAQPLYVDPPEAKLPLGGPRPPPV